LCGISKEEAIPNLPLFDGAGKAIDVYLIKGELICKKMEEWCIRAMSGW